MIGGGLFDIYCRGQTRVLPPRRLQTSRFTIVVDDTLKSQSVETRELAELGTE
jgi:hypothetical protein